MHMYASYIYVIMLNDCRANIALSPQDNKQRTNDTLGA